MEGVSSAFRPSPPAAFPTPPRQRKPLSVPAVRVGVGVWRLALSEVIAKATNKERGITRHRHQAVALLLRVCLDL